MQKWGLFETQGTTKGQIGEKLNYSKFLDYYEAAQKAYDECKITQHHLEIVLQKFNDFKVVSNLSIIEELCQNYYGMIHLGVVKITMTEWKNCPINELMQHYEVYKSLSKTKTNQ